MSYTKNSTSVFQIQRGSAVSESGVSKRSYTKNVWSKALLIAVLFSMTVFPLAAQDEGAEAGDDEEALPPTDIDSRWQSAYFETFTRGDGTFNIHLGVIFPAMFSVGSAEQYDPPVGGTGRLSGSYFLNSHVFVGGGVQAMFMPTIGEHMLYVVPMGAHVGYEWTAGRFEFPLSLTIGWAWEMYLEHLYFGFFAKPQFSVLYRVFNDWSFGLTTSWWFVPQWGANTVDDTGKTVKGGSALGNFVELTLMAQYHF
jgi:hypothetical protein